MVTASHRLRSTPMDLVVRAHEDRSFAPAFRDIKKYSRFEVDDDGSIHTAYDARVGFLKFPMEVVKRVRRLDDGTTAVVGFETSDACLASFQGEWKVRRDPDNPAGSIVDLAQTVAVPSWARFLPIEAAIRSRVQNALVDMDALGPPRPPAAPPARTR